MWLLLLHPSVAVRSCTDCQKHVYDDRVGNFAAQPFRMGGRVVLRLVGQPTPCGICPKIPPDAVEKTPQTAEEWSDRNIQAYRHYLQCKAVSEFPDDPIVRRNAAIIRRVEDMVQSMSITSRLDGLTQVMARAFGG